MPRYRNVRIVVMVTEEEKNDILTKMKKVGMTNLGKFIRIVLKNIEIINIDLQALYDLSYEVNKVGVNLNQIAKAVNTTGNIYKNDIEKIQKEFKEHYEFLNKLKSAARKIN